MRGKGGEPMPDETATILEIMRAAGVYDFVIGKVKNQAEAVRMFRDDFEAASITGQQNQLSMRM